MIGTACKSEDLEKLLDKFIDKYILCETCGNPETDLKITKNRLSYSCRACGAITLIDYEHRITDYIEKKIRESEKKEKKKSKTIPHNPNLITALRNFWKLNPSDEEILEQITIFQEENELHNNELISIIFDSLFDKNFLTQFDQKCKIYLLFKEKFKVEYYSSTLYYLECLCKKEDSVYSSINTILEHFLQHHILDQESLNVWYDNPSPSINTDFSQQIRQQTKSLIVDN